MKGKKQFSGYLGDCSPEQLSALEKFRNQVQAMDCLDDRFDDPYLLRFLRARNFDLPKTLEMWKNYIQWRKANNVDKAMDFEFPEIFEAKKYYPHGFFRTDKQGRPMYFERCGLLKIDQFTKVMTQERIEAFSIQKYERLMNIILPGCSRAAGKRIEQTCFIVDLKNFKSSKMTSKTWDLVKLMSKIGSNYYPETLGVMFIVNAPVIFYGIWNVAKYFLEEETRQKIHILGSKYHKELLEYINEEDLPDFLGGKTTSEDYGENFTQEQGPWVRNPIKTPNFSQIDQNESREEEEFGEKEFDNSGNNSKAPIKISFEPFTLNANSNINQVNEAVLANEDVDFENLEVAAEGIQTLSIREFKSQPSLHLCN